MKTKYEKPKITKVKNMCFSTALILVKSKKGEICRQCSS